jgi:hypothetical protein
MPTRTLRCKHLRTGHAHTHIALHRGQRESLLFGAADVLLVLRRRHTADQHHARYQAERGGGE